jgi:microsomal epoxide hydrolase
MPYPENAAEHLPLEDVEKEGLDGGDEFGKTGTAYALEQATRPATIGFVLSSSPLALLAWYAQRRHIRFTHKTCRSNAYLQDWREVPRLVRHDTIA